MIIFTQPFLVGAPLAEKAKGRVVVLDLAFNAGSPQGKGTNEEQLAATTAAFIDTLGERLMGWLDHHPHAVWPEYGDDPRFWLVSREEAPACPPLITPEWVSTIGLVDTIVAHGDFDGVMSVVKFLLGGIEPYSGADNDAIAADTRRGEMTVAGREYDQAMKANLADNEVRQAIVTELVSAALTGKPDHDAAYTVNAAKARYAAIQVETERLAALYQIEGKTAVVDAAEAKPFDLTALLMVGQKKAEVAIARNTQRGVAQVTIAGPPIWDFRQAFGLIGGMPNRVNIADRSLEEVAAIVNAM